MKIKVVFEYHNLLFDGEIWSIGYADYMSEKLQMLDAYVVANGFATYVSLDCIPAYWFWYDNFACVDTGILIREAYRCNQHGKNILKGWAALNCLVDDLDILTNHELALVFEAANQHKKTLVGQRAMKLVNELREQRHDDNICPYCGEQYDNPDIEHQVMCYGGDYNNPPEYECIHIFSSDPDIERDDH